MTTVDGREETTQDIAGTGAEPLPPEFFNAPGKDPHGLAATLRASCPVHQINHPPGAEAHQIINTGTKELRYLAISDSDEVDVIDYPDSGKMGVAAGIKDRDFSTATYRAFGRVVPAEYFDDEEPPRS